MMEHDGLRESDMDVDLESAETDTTSEEDRSTDSDTCERQPKEMMGRLRSGHMRHVNNGLTRGSDGYLSSSMSSGEDLDVQRKTEDRTRIKEKQRKTSSKKHPKPPRPPGGPLLDAADMKLVKEISEHARSRRARREKMKELKKKRADKISLSNIHIFAMLITIIFCFVVILQGMLGSRV